MLDRPIKILYFITSLDIGGAEQLLYLTLKHIDRKKFYPTVCCFYAGKLAQEIEELGIEVVDLRVRHKLDFSFLFKLYRLLRERKFDIMHTHLFHANIAGRVMARVCAVPVVVSTQHYAFKYNGNFGIMLEKATCGLADRVIAVSEAAKAFYSRNIGIKEEKIILIYNGVDTDIEKWASLPDPGLDKQLGLGEQFVIGCVGRLAQVKGQTYLLQAIKELAGSGIPLKALIIGSGPQEAKLKKQAGELGIAGQVCFLDARRDIQQAMGAFDINILPSLQEGLSIILLEALAMAKPSIATATGGNPEVIIDGENGILVPPADYKALAAAIEYLYKNKEKRVLLGQKGRQRVIEKFNIVDNVSRMQLLYEQLLEDRMKI